MHPVKSQPQPELVISDECIAEFSRDWDLACSGWSEEVRKGNVEWASNLVFAILMRRENGILQTAFPFFCVSASTLSGLADFYMEKGSTLEYFSYSLETVISPVLSGRFEPTPDFVADALYRLRDHFSSREKERAKKLLRILIELGRPVL